MHQFTDRCPRCNSTQVGQLQWSFQLLKSLTMLFLALEYGSVIKIEERGFVLRMVRPSCGWTWRDKGSVTEVRVQSKGKFL